MNGWMDVFEGWRLAIDGIWPRTGRAIFSIRDKMHEAKDIILYL
jgi:hypothetical protein